MKKFFGIIMIITWLLLLAACGSESDSVSSNMSVQRSTEDAGDIMSAYDDSSESLAQQLDLGLKYLSMMEYERAIDAYLDAIEIDPECKEAYFGLAAVHYVTGETEKAGAALHQPEADVSGIFSYGLAPSDDGKGQLEIQGLSEISLKVVVIPEKIDGYPVKKISLRDCGNLTYVIIPDSVTEISPGGFSGCGNLKAIYTPQGSAAEGWAQENGYEVVNIMP